jgi:glycosyltransferase involved in cell wall biosynthesis
MRPRVAMVVSNTAPNPGALLAARLRHLLDLGWDARLLCKGEAWMRDPALRDPALSRRVELTPGRERYGPPAALLRRPSGLARYRHAAGRTGPFDGRLLNLRPDLIHFHSGVAGWKGMRLKQLLGCRVVVSFRADGKDLAIPDPELLWEGADLLIFPEAAALERAAARGWPRDRAEVLHEPVVSAGAMVERQHQAGCLRVLSAGSVIWEQGFEHSVHAVRLLRDMGIGCEYRIVGDGDHLPAVAFARHQLGLADHVQLLAPDGSDRLVEEMRSADAFVDPAVTDTTSPTGLITAQAGALPFVATRRAGLPEEAGIAVPRRNPGAIAEALALLADDPGLRKRMGQAGRRIQGQRLDDHLAQLVGLYRRALGR